MTHFGFGDSHWNRETRKLSGRLKDYIFPLVGYGLPDEYPFSLRGYNFLKEYVEKIEEVTLPKGKTLVLTRIPEVTAENLDLEASTCLLWLNDEKCIRNAQKLVFKSSVPEIFKLSGEDCYCTEEMKKKIERGKLTGFAFSPAFFASCGIEKEEKNLPGPKMMVFSEYKEQWFHRWKEEEQAVRAKLTEEDQKILDEIDREEESLYFCSSDIPNVRKAWNHYVRENQENSRPTLSAFMKQRLGFAIDLYVQPQFQEDYYSFVDEYVTFHHDNEIVSDDPALCLYQALNLLHTYRFFSLYQADVADYCANRMNEMGLSIKWREYHDKNLLETAYMCDLIAYRLNANDEVVVQYMKDLLSNVKKIPLGTFRFACDAVTRCKNKELHEKLCEAMNEFTHKDKDYYWQLCVSVGKGRADIHQKVLEKIEENQSYLINDVKKHLIHCINGNSWNPKLYSDDIASELCKALKNPIYAIELTESDDCTKIQIGLAAIGFYDVRNSLRRCIEMLNHPSRSQLFAIRNMICLSAREGRRIPIKAMKNYADDMEIVGLYLNAYFHWPSSIYETFLSDKEDGLDYHYFVDEEEELHIHFQIMKKIADEMDEKKDVVSYSFTKSDIVSKMAILACLSQNKQELDEVNLRLNDLNKNCKEQKRIRQFLLQHFKPLI